MSEGVSLALEWKKEAETVVALALRWQFVQGTTSSRDSRMPAVAYGWIGGMRLHNRDRPGRRRLLCSCRPGQRGARWSGRNKFSAGWAVNTKTPRRCRTNSFPRVGMAENQPLCGSSGIIIGRVPVDWGGYRRDELVGTQPR